MTKYLSNTSKIINYSHTLFAAGVIASGLSYLVSPADAAPVLSIKNQATASYEEQNDLINDRPRVINTVSNTIEIAIGEVAGITVSQNGITDDKGVGISSINPSKTIYVYFDVTNIGNDGTKIFVPNKATLNGAGRVEKIQYFDASANNWIDIVGTGFSSDNLDKNKAIKVRIIVKINDGASGNLSVSLGKTAPVSNRQNIEIINANIDTLKTSDRVFTIDNNDSIEDEIAGIPNNGTREAMNTQTISIIQIEAILNGTKDNPAAQGVGNDNNQDYTNKSILTSVQRGEVLNPPVIGFTNTIENSTSQSADIKILPVLKTDEMLPNGTTITLRDSQRPTADFDVVFTVINGAVVPNNSNKKTLVVPQVPSIFKLNRTASTFRSFSFANIDRPQTNSVKLVAGNNLDRLGLEISQTNLVSNTSYITAIDLPNGTEVLKPYAIKLIAFIDQNNDDLPNATELQNTTIDRAYTGFIDVFKESRVLDIDNRTVLKDFSPAPKLAKTGQYLEYRITFKNISPNTVDANGSQGISAANFTIIEDGYSTPNNWGGLTENDPNSAIVSVGSVAFTRSDKTTTTTIDPRVTKYIHSVGTLAPQSQGTFIFRRRISQ